jgi:hypothetical protein
MTTAQDTETWRDLIDQLTPEQTERLERYASDPDYMVRVYGEPHVWDDTSLLDAARRMARENNAVKAIGEVPWPPDAISVGEWTDADSPEPFRGFEIAARHVDKDVEVQSSGFQYLNGADEREITIHGADPYTPLNAESARALAAALIAAAEDLENAQVGR